MHSSFAQMKTSKADGMGRFASTFGSSSSYQGTLDPYLSMLYTYCPRTVGFTAFGSSNFMRGYGTVGAGITASFITKAKDIHNIFLAQVTAAIGADVYNKSEFESVGVPKDNGAAGLLSKISAKPSLNVLLYGTTINNKEAGGFTLEGYLRMGKLAAPLGWVQGQYNVLDWLGMSAYYSNDFGLMGGVVTMPSDGIRIFLGGGTGGLRGSLTIDTF